jgi:hypothetical protein
MYSRHPSFSYFSHCVTQSKNMGSKLEPPIQPDETIDSILKSSVKFLSNPDNYISDINIPTKIQNEG